MRYHPPVHVEYWTKARWSCDGLIHEHLSERAALECERKYPDAAPVGRYRRPVKREGNRR